MRGDTVRIGGGEALSSFRAATRNPGAPARDYVNKSPACSLWTPHRVRGDTMRIGDGEALSSFRATTRNPEIPGHGITQYSRTVRHYSTLCHLQSWAPHRVRVTRLCSFFSAARRTNQEAPPLLSGYLARRLAPPSSTQKMSRTFRSTISKDIPAYLVIPRHDAESRNTRARYNSRRTSRAALLHQLPPPEAGPRVECGVTQCASRVG